MGTAEDVRGEVDRALTADPMITADDIVVELMGSDVLLNGTVPSQAELSEAAATAQRAAGQATIHNLLEVAEPLEDYGDDAALAGFANEALTADPAVPAGVAATASEGSITLTGTVSTAAERSAAEDAVAGVGGVLSTINEIVILGAGPAPGG